MSAKRDNISGQRRWSILQRDNFTCAYCGAQPGNDQLNVDHIIPIARRGSDHDNNLITACSRCNQGKGNQIAVPLRMCAEPCNAEGWTTWMRWGDWKLEWSAEAIYLDYRNSYPIEIERVHEPDWREHIADKEWPSEVKLDFYQALAFARTLIRTKEDG